MNVLVTGGAGFIGSAFVRLILNNLKGFDSLKKLVVLDSLTYSGNLENLEEVKNDSRLEVVIGSINSQTLLQKLMSKIDLVVHFAAESHVDRSIQNADLFVQTNIVGTFNVLNSALNANVKRVIHVSTDEVYGSIRNGLFSEKSNLLPNSPYAASKASSDLIARSFFQTHNLPVIITRCSNNYGRYQHPEKLIPLSITNLLKGKKIPIYGTGLNEREWIHVDDHCRAIASLSLIGKFGDIYNIGGKNRITNIALVSKIIELMGFNGSVLEFVEDRKGHDFRYAMDVSKIHDLGFREEVDLESGLKDVISWYRKNIDWWSRGLIENSQS
jgi:dTDP-glucose 4,6-dehydratase